MEGVDPLESVRRHGMLAKRAMQFGDHAEALRMISMALAQLKSFKCPSHYAAPFLLDRAECLWQLGNVQASLQNMEDAINHGLANDAFFAEEESLKWSQHGQLLLQNNELLLAEHCANFALYFRTSSNTRAQAHACRAFAQHGLGKSIGARNDINEVKRLDGGMARFVARQTKDVALKSFQNKNYERSLKDLHLALLFHPEDSYKAQFKRSVESHQATAYFRLRKYKKAVELGEEGYKSNPLYKSKEEANRWKERGNHVSKETIANSVDLAIACYSLALNFVPSHEKDLKATFLSNRCLMYLKQEKADEALQDAQQCVDNKPSWTKAQYRLGSCLFARKKYSEAMKPFSQSLQLSLRDSSSSEHHKVDTLTQLLSVALALPDGTSSITYTVPKTLIQKVIDTAVTEKDWDRLHLLFMGGGGEKQFEKGSGGLGTGCDASSVPLEEVICCDSVPDLTKFISVLLDHRASASPQKGSKDLLDVAIRLEKFDVVNMLMDRGNNSGPGVKTSTSNTHKRTIKAEGVEAVRKGENNKAIDLLQLSLKHEQTKVDEQRKTLQLLCELYFKEKSFNECLETGRKLKATFWGETSEENNSSRIERANQWKKWGNELHKESKYDLMAEYYSLALEFTPQSNSEITTALLSNRCLAFINLKKFRAALADAEKCIQIKPQWFRGHSRRGTCLLHLKQCKEALKAFCKAHIHALSDKEKHATANEVISTAVDVEDGETQITCTFSSQVLECLVKEASEKNEWKKLRFLYLGTTANNRGIATRCDASFVPLDLLIESEVEDLHKLVILLLERGALPDGLRGCRRPPLQAAMEMMKFPLAVTLLKNKADPSCIVGHGIFINKEGQPKQWLHLGRKALDSNDHKKAVMLLNMSLYLITNSSTDLPILTQAYYALAEAHFKLNEHERAIDAGKECFKLRPIKSEDEAKEWQHRASHVFKLGHFTSCIECVNLALKYTPADSKRTFSLLLCQRSEAGQQLGDYSSALEDGKKASMMTPELLEGYLNQFRCFRALKREREAMQAINECLKRTTDENLMGDLLCDALDIAVTLEESTTALTATATVPSQLLTTLVMDTIKLKDWTKLKILYLGGGGPTSQLVGRGGLATNIDTCNVPLGEVIRYFGPEESLLISALLEHGASVNNIEGSDVIPLEEVMNQGNLFLVEKLVQKGANYCVTCSDGEPIIHKALRKGLKSGDFRFLEAMVECNTTEIENVLDSSDNTLYHLVCSGRKTGKKSSPYKCDAIRILRNANVNPDHPNKKGMRPIEMLSKKDYRWKMVSNSIDSFKSKTAVDFPSEGNSENVSNEDQQQENLLTVTEDEEGTDADEHQLTREEETLTPTKVNKGSRVDDKQQHRIKMRENIAGLINALSPLATFVPMEATEEQEDNDIFDELSAGLDTMEHEEGQLKDEIVQTPAEEGDSKTDATEHESGDDEMEAEIDSQSPFEDLPWEVDCTDRVWKVMRSKRVDNNMRRRIVSKIRMLANGRWSKTLCKRLEGDPKKEGIQLYESKLTKGQRIIWEKTIAFSGRLSDEPEHRLNEETSGGRIYSDIIRVWDIVLDHDKLQRSIEHIVKSYDRGMLCLIKKKLKGITGKSQNDSTPSGECLPNKYADIADLNFSTKPPVKKEIPKKPAASEDLSQIFFPPASANEQEYHILKFYSFSTPLVKTVLESDTSAKVDFPFKITELEHAIVNIRPNPPTPIILLGRSGTGKTTCCLYRLWDNFQRYWESAVTAGPHIPKYVPTGEAPKCDDEVNYLQRSSEQGACSQDTPAQASECHEFEACCDSDVVSTTQDGEESKELGAHNEDCDTDLMNGPQTYEHLHQIFITKNTVLCSEVEKNFKELCRACPAVEQRLQFEDRPIPTKIQDVDEEEWPLFVNARDWLLMLDASLPGTPFFKRVADGSLLRKIEGWGEEDNHLQFIPATDSDGESDDEEGEKVTENDSEEPKERKKESKVERDPRREITYQVFLRDIWPKMKKSSKEKVDYHPTLVWTEIKSFIKGSAEALVSDNGVLSLEDYESLGRKKAPSFSADRKVVYALFRVYQREHSSNRMFDEADLVFNIHRRLQSIPAPEWSVHQFYVDETQDFTQAELSLLIRCCRFPNELFFTGDTAQSIMRGIAFRFEDLKTLFHHAKEAAGITEGPHNVIQVPKKLYQLTHNYRSHAGILHLASSVVDLLLYYFPESFDKLHKDEGLFKGPKPVLLESCSPTDLALILQGNQRQSSRIEFGAHQVVLVVSNEAREAMPVELKQGLVMTIYEAKGLEFDDVLIYNFFKDSQAGKEWRVVTSFVENQSMENVLSSTGLAEITEESVGVQHRSRPLEFDPEKHKVLNSEFKYLYTAITRARVNVWFFDEDKEARTPVFEYFRRMGLVQVVVLEDKEQRTGELASMFAVKSAPEEWRKGGMRFYKKRLWVTAIQCFTFAGDMLMLQKSQAQQQAAEAIKHRSTNRQQMRDEFLRAGESFLQCAMYDEVEICLHNAREWILLAKLYEKTGKYQDAARLFKKNGLPMEASRCYESQNNYRDAIETLCLEGRIEEALDALERFNILSSSGDSEGRHGIIPPRPTRTVERLRHKLADQHFKNGNIEGMEEVLQHLPSTNDRITFLKKRGCIIEAARAMESVGRKDEAARLLGDQGRFQEAVKYSSDPKFTADCLVSQARTTRVTEDTTHNLQTALEKYQQCHDIIGQAEALLMLGKLSKQVQKIQEASRLFDKCKNCCGEVESVADLLETTCHSPPENFRQWIPVRALERVLRLVTLLYKPGSQLSMAEQKDVEKCEQHFGLFPTDTAHKMVYFCKHGGRFSRVDPEFIKNNASKVEATIDTVEAHQKIGRFLVNFSVTLIAMIRKMLENTFLRSSVCRKLIEGERCDNSSCECLHEDSEEVFHNCFHALFNFVYLESVVEQNILEMTANKIGIDVSPLIFIDFREFATCQRFYRFLFPPSGCRRYHLTWPHVRSIRMTKAVNRRILQFANFSWKKTTEEKRRSDTDNFLKVSSSLQLIGSASSMVRWICEEENEFQKKEKNPFRLTNDLLAKNGMVFKSDSGRCESFLQWWEDGKKRLYVHGDVENAAHLIIRRFLTLTAKRSRMIFPSIANTVMVLEHQLAACLALYTRLCIDHRYPICLPGSYLTMVRFWDNFRPNVDKGTFTLYQAVECNASQETNKPRLLRAVCSILNYMVKLACGDVDVFGYALSSHDTPVEEAERSLVLFLTMLSNCGKGIPISVEDVMLRKIFNLSPNPCLPSRIKNVLVEIQQAKGCCDIVEILKNFLQSRGEVLYDLRWHNGKLWYDGPSNPSSYLQRFITDIAIIREELQQSERRFQGEAPRHEDALGSADVDSERTDLEATVESMEVTYTDEELKEKEELRLHVKAAIIQRWYIGMKQAKVLRARKLSRLKSVEEQTKASTNVSEDHFSRFKVDSSACRICGTNFKALTDDYQLPISHEDNEGDFQESSQQVKGISPDEEFETAEAHKKSQAHLQKVQEFQQYKDLYLAEIHPCLMKEDELRNMVEDIFLNGEKRGMEDVELDLNRLETTRSTVKNRKQTIESSLDWTNTSSLMNAVKELRAGLQEIDKILEQAKTDSLAGEHSDEEGTEEREDEKEDEGEDVKIKEIQTAIFQDEPKRRRKRKKR